MEKDQEHGTVLKYLRMMVLVAGISACAQAVVWVFFTITGVIIYTQCPENKIFPTFGSMMRETYFTDDKCLENSEKLKLYMSSGDLLIWECVIMALMVLWFLSSILLIGGVRQSSLNKQSTVYLILWSVLTLIISSIDLALGIIFGLDSSYVLKENPNSDLTNLKNQLLSTVSGVLMTVALRGFILWLINVAASIYFIMGVVEINNAENGSKQTAHATVSQGALNAYETNSIEQRSSHWLADAENMDRPKIQSQLSARTLGQQGEVNQGYVSYMDQPNRYQQQQPLASIMKKSVAARNEDRLSSQNRPKEYNIPSPDYSPVQTRKQYKPQMSDNSYNNNYNKTFYDRR